MKKNTIKLNEESLLKALYIGLYQQIKLNGVNSTKYRIARPKTVKFSPANNNARPPIIFNANTSEWTEKKKPTLIYYIY